MNNDFIFIVIFGLILKVFNSNNYFYKIRVINILVFIMWKKLW